MSMDTHIMELKNIYPTKIIRNCKPICFHENKLVVNKYDSLFFLENDKLSNKPICNLPNTWSKKILNLNSLAYRVLRSGVNFGISFDEFIYVIHTKKLYQINPKSGIIKLEINFKNGNGPLSIAKIISIDGFYDGLYFGDYFSNLNKDVINIYRRTTSSNMWEVIYTFKKGEINHIHSLIPDEKNKCVWILAGDFDNSAGIWKATDNFNNVEPILCGNQQYRACVAFPLNGGLLYATDSQLETNYIRFLKKTEDVWKSEIISEINGSCIYGCMLKDNFVFSTTTEPYGLKDSFIQNLFDRKRGKGIIKNESHIIIGNIENGFNIIFKNKKDIFPYNLFRFGTIIFPNGKNETNTLYSYSIANKINDLDLEIRCVDI